MSRLLKLKETAAHLQLTTEGAPDDASAANTIKGRSQSVHGIQKETNLLVHSPPLPTRPGREEARRV